VNEQLAGAPLLERRIVFPAIGHVRPLLKMTELMPPWGATSTVKPGPLTRRSAALAGDAVPVTRPAKSANAVMVMATFRPAAISRTNLNEGIRIPFWFVKEGKDANA
jgi:hypothetical protein